jgi:hypothetical protein
MDRVADEAPDPGGGDRQGDASGAVWRARALEGFHPDFGAIRREFWMRRYLVRTRGVLRLTDKGRAVMEGG